MAQRSWRGEEEEEAFHDSEVINGPEQDWKPGGKQSVASPVLRGSGCLCSLGISLLRACVSPWAKLTAASEAGDVEGAPGATRDTGRGAGTANGNHTLSLCPWSPGGTRAPCELNVDKHPKTWQFRNTPQIWKS